MTGCCEHLPWDSAFFGVRIARLVVAHASPAVLAKADEWCRTYNIDCLYLLTDAPLTEPRPGYHHVDVRLTLQAPITGGPAAAIAVEEAGPADLADLRRLASANHVDSRFYADARLAPRASEMYAEWIARSVADPAEAVLIPAPRPAVGYITCRCDGSAGRIGLFGVGRDARGRGLGRGLVAAALHWFAAAGARTAQVVTQGDNTAARRVYESCGFALVCRQYWYHRWAIH